MIDPRVIEILRILQEANDYVPAESLAESIGVRSRTLRDMMRQVKAAAVKDNGFELLHKYNYGFRLMIVDQERFRVFFAQESRNDLQNRFDMPATAEERCSYLIRFLLMNRTPVKTEDILERMYISRSTLASDLKNVRTMLKDYELTLETRSAGGLLITGEEYHIRACISDFFFYTDFADSESFRKQPIAVFGMHNESAVSEIVDDVLTGYSYHMTDVGINNLKIHLLIALYRIQNHESSQKDKPSIDEEHFVQEFRMAREIRDRLEERTSIHIDDEDLGYMVIHMVGTRILTEKDTNMISAETINMVRTILTEVLDRTGVDFFEDVELFTMLTAHVEPMLSRIVNHVKMRNPLLDRIRKENSTGFDMAVIACEVISNHYHAEIDENEIGYLALHFELALQRRNVIHKKRILTVCASGAGTSNLLKYNLLQNFGSSIESVDSAGLFDLNHMDLSCYDMIISTVPLPYKGPIPVLTVQYYLSSEDKEDIRRTLAYNEKSVEEAVCAFRRKLFFDHIELQNRNEAIHFLSTQLSNDIPIPSDFEEKVMEREYMASTNMDNGIAVPHPTRILLEETRIAVCHLDKPIAWGDGKKVSWVFLIGMKRQNTPSDELLSRTLYRLFSNTDAMADLSAHPQYDYFIEKIHSLLSVKEKQESIFK